MAPDKKKRKKKVEGAAVSSSNPSTSEKKIPDSLKPETKIMKKSLVKKNSIKAKKPNGSTSLGHRVNEQDMEKSNLKKGQKESSRNHGEGIELNQKEGNEQKSNTNKEKTSETCHLNQNQKTEEQFDDESNKYQQRNEKSREELGGLIFMCNAKTKPDCFRYRVMGLPLTKRDLVLNLKPGLKLFLYDFDLKLMYGVYKATSSGGMKLEPRAFDGAFPVQVRFDVHMDCCPLPEIVFRRAIKENYNERQKFRTELTAQQVKNLIGLFQQAVVKTSAPSMCPSPMARNEDNKNNKVRREPMSLHREVAFLSEREYRTYGLRRDIQDANTPPRHGGPTLEEPYQRNFEREIIPGHNVQNLDIHPRHVAPVLEEPYHRYVERESVLRHPNLIYRDSSPLERQPVHHNPNPPFISEKEYRAYGLSGRRELPTTAPLPTAAAIDRGPYHTYHNGATSTYVEPYYQPLRREEIPLGSTFPVRERRESYLNDHDNLRRREIDGGERLSSNYASDGLSDYDRLPHYQGERPELTLPPVTAKYSFAGPSYSYR